MVIETLRQAIMEKCVISFEYNKLGKVYGTRIGNPHAIFIMQKKDGSVSTKVDIYQTRGESDSTEKIPGWRPFNIEDLTNVKICDPIEYFHEEPDYKPESDRYSSFIAKI